MTLQGQPAWFAKQLLPVQCRPPPQSSDALHPRVPWVGQTAAVGSTTGTTSLRPPHAAKTKIAKPIEVSALGSTSPTTLQRAEAEAVTESRRASACPNRDRPPTDARSPRRTRRGRPCRPR